MYIDIKNLKSTMYALILRYYDLDYSERGKLLNQHHKNISLKVIQQK